ncbi:MAG: 3-dehydroquinate synthase [Actinobacteria bacterium]|nr:3-dehydroquinate synthase [Actinomycetota bacterium]
MSDHSEFTVASSSGGYEVRIGSGRFGHAVEKADVVVVDAALAARVPAGERPLLTITADEDTKTLAGCERLILEMRAAGVRRGDHVVAVGGGVVQDVATFVTDVYMRGLPWSYVPTTLMAMADSCIGGKSSINVGGVKNLVVGIYPPQQVVVDPVFLQTLDSTARAAGLSEAAKIAFCRSSESFEGYLERYARFVDEPSDLIEHVLRAKRWFVEIDEHDRKERRLLNFGHTFGHALEAAVDHAIPHGVAVSIGVLCAAAHPAAGAGPLTDALTAHCRELVGQAPGMPAALARFDADVYERAFRSDKKHSAHAFRLILPAAEGSVAEVETGNGPQDWAAIAAVTDSTLESLGGPRA